MLGGREGDTTEGAASRLVQLQPASATIATTPTTIHPQISPSGIRMGNEARPTPSGPQSSRSGGATEKNPTYSSEKKILLVIFFEKKAALPRARARAQYIYGRRRGVESSRVE